MEKLELVQWKMKLHPDRSKSSIGVAQQNQSDTDEKRCSLDVQLDNYVGNPFLHDYRFDGVVQRYPSPNLELMKNPKILVLEPKGMELVDNNSHLQTDFVERESLKIADDFHSDED